MTIPRTYARATSGAAKGGIIGAHSAGPMRRLRLAAALVLACFGVILLARCGGGSTAITIEIQPSVAPTVDASALTCNAPNNLSGCEVINFTATVGGDKTNSGVNWNLTKLSTGCAGNGCGILINATAVSVTYIAPSNIAAELSGVMLQAVSNASANTTQAIGISVVLDPAFSLSALQQCAVGVYCLPSGSNGIAYNSNQSLVVTNGVAPYTFIPQTAVPAPIQINGGGPAVPPFVADEDFTGGVTIGSANAINTSNVTDPAPAAVYQTARTGNFTYTITGFTPGSIHLLRLHFCETQFTKAGMRTFNVSINGLQVLTTFDIFAAAGGEYIANIQQFTGIADGNGNIAIQFTTVLGNALVSGIEVEPNACPITPLNIGTLPPGLTLNPATGAIVGKPTSPTAGNAAIPFQFTVQATDTSNGPPVSACENFQITITPPPPLTITTTTLPPGTVDAAFSAPISTNGGVTPLTFSIINPNSCATINGLLPAGLMLNPASGQVTGIPKGPPVSCSFTIQVVDSSLPSNMAQTETQLISVTINAPKPLGITSPPTLPGGFTATTYGPLPLIATGGVGPYTWTLIKGQLPAGLTLAPDGTISGTPVLATNPPTDYFFTVQVADSELDPITGLPAPQTLTQVFNITISPGVINPNTLLNGQYTFLFNGFDVTGPVTIIGTVTMSGNGVLSGEEDIYRQSGVVSNPPAPVAGVYLIGTDGRGTMELVASNPVSNAVLTTDYRLVLDSGGGSGHPNVRFFEDNSTNTNNDAPDGTHGEGIMKPAVGSSFTDANFGGNYAFGFGGYESAGKLPVALAGVVHADSTTPMPSLTGTCDFNDAGAYSSQTLSGTFDTTVDGMGRGLAQLDFAQPGKSQVTLSFVYYFVSPTDMFFMENDTSATNKSVFYQLNGEMLLQQPGYQFTNAALAGTSVATVTGLDDPGNAGVFAGLLTGPACDGSTAVSLDYDQNVAGIINDGTGPGSPLPSSGICTISSNGHVVFPNFRQIQSAYLVGPGQGFTIGINPVVDINAGGPAVYPFVADEDFTGGSTISSGNTINISKPPIPAPAAVYQTARVGTFSYTIPGLAPNTNYDLVMHFCDTVSTAAGQRVFNVSVNGTQVLTSLDIFASAGGQNIAIIAQGPLPTNSSGQYVIQFTPVVGQALVSGIEVLSGATTGLLELQTSAPPFVASSLQGSYTLGTAFPQDSQVTNVIGQVNSNGSTSVTGTVDEYDPPSALHLEGVLDLGQSLVSSYLVSGTGRGTLATNSLHGFPQNLIFYIVSPGSFRAISADTNPGNGHPVVYFFNQ